MSIDYVYDESPTEFDENDCKDLVARIYAAGTVSPHLRMIVLPQGELKNSDVLPSDPLLGIIRRNGGGAGWSKEPPSPSSFEVGVHAHDVQQIIGETLIDVAVANSPVIGRILKSYVSARGQKELYQRKTAFLAVHSSLTPYGPVVEGPGYVPIASTARASCDGSASAMAARVASVWSEFIASELNDFLPTAEGAALAVRSIPKLDAAINSSTLIRELESFKGTVRLIAILRISSIRRTPKVTADLDAIFKPGARIGSIRVFDPAVLDTDSPVRRMAERKQISLIRTFVRS